jgi:hypothetical protein
MAAVRGIFAVSDSVYLKNRNYWTSLSDVWINQLPNTGYFIRGSIFPGTNLSNIDKLDYSTDTTFSLPSFAIGSGTGHNALASLTNGYVIGGFSSPSANNFKLTFSSDTVALTPSIASSPPTNAAECGNTTSGYFSGGQQVTTTLKLTYSSDTLAPSPTTNLTIVRFSYAASGSETAGYYSGGTGGGIPDNSTTDKLTYSNDLFTQLPNASLYYPTSVGTASGNSTNGYNGNGFPAISRAKLTKLVYATDTRSGGSGMLYSVRSATSTGNSTSGYFGGGFSPASGYSTMNKLNYSTDVMQDSISGRLSIGRYDARALSARANSLNLWTRFSDGSTTSNLASIPTVTPTSQTALSESQNTGYFGGGFTPGPLFYSTMDKLTYSSDTTAAVPGAALSAARGDLAATGSSTAGYFGGGNSGAIPGPLSLMNKLTYSTDTTNTPPSANLGAGRYRLAATGNSTAGYFGGGVIVPGARTTMEKIFYSGDLTISIPTANLSIGRSLLAATGSSTAGYFGGGSNIVPARVSTMDKLTYSTDITVFTPTANLSAAREDLAATGNSTAGYFGGGIPGPLSTMDKLTYSTDTTVFTHTANLSVVRWGLAATGNSTAGYFGGGLPGPGPLSSMDKLTYSTDTTAAAPSGANLSAVRDSLAASSARANALSSSVPLSVVV